MSYFDYEYHRRVADRRIRTACRAMVLFTVVGVVALLIYSHVRNIFMPDIVQGSASPMLLRAMAVFSEMIEGVEKAINGIGFVVIGLSLRRDGRIAKGHIVAPFVLAATWGLEIFLSTQWDYLQLTICDLVVTTALLLYACLAFATVRWEEYRDEDGRSA